MSQLSNSGFCFHQIEGRKAVGYSSWASRFQVRSLSCHSTTLGEDTASDRSETREKEKQKWKQEEERQEIEGFSRTPIYGYVSQYAHFSSDPPWWWLKFVQITLRMFQRLNFEYKILLVLLELVHGSMVQFSPISIGFFWSQVRNLPTCWHAKKWNKKGREDIC